MTTPNDALSACAATIARKLPAPMVRELAHQIEQSDWPMSEQSRQRILGVVPEPNLQKHVRDLMTMWRTADPDAVALMLRGAAATAERLQTEQSVELIWTGPTVIDVPLRRTDEGLLDVIEAANTRLLIVSFAVYKIKSVTEAAIRAVERGVRLQICLETPDAGKVDYDTIGALGHELRTRAEFYVWPTETRKQFSDGAIGSLHAKCAVADLDTLFVSSANLTEYAMTRNMEMGVLIRGGRLPGLVATHFDRLIQNGVLVHE